MKDLYKAIKDQLKTVDSIQHVKIWNNQAEQIANERQEGNYGGYTCKLPAAFVEIISPTDIQQLGNGVQIYDPVIVNIHIIDDFYNGDEMEENLEIFDLKQEVYEVLQKFEPTGAVAFWRSQESQDTEHTNIYHFIQSYTTNYIDSSREEPVGFKEKEPPTDLEITGAYEN